MLWCRCLQCGKQFQSERDADFCPKHQKEDDAVYANDPGPVVPSEPWKWSRAAMQERLSVSGDRDE